MLCNRWFVDIPGSIYSADRSLHVEQFYFYFYLFFGFLVFWFLKEKKKSFLLLADDDAEYADVSTNVPVAALTAQPSNPTIDWIESRWVDGMSHPLFDPFRAVVSQNKIRFKDDTGITLDLAFITDHIIAMAYPMDNSHAIYRNPLDKVKAFFDRKFPNK
jgi:hypothetical protein